MRRARKVAKTTEDHVPTILPDISAKKEKREDAPVLKHYTHNEDPVITEQEFFDSPPDSFEWVDEFGTTVTGQLLEVTDNLIRYLMTTDDGRFNITCVYKRKNEESKAAADLRKLPAWRVIPIDVVRINDDMLVRLEVDFAVFAFKYCFGIEECTEQW